MEKDKNEDANIEKQKDGYFWSGQWMERIAEVMEKVKNDKSLSYDERNKMLNDYRKAMSSVN